MIPPLQEYLESMDHWYQGLQKEKKLFFFVLFGLGLCLRIQSEVQDFHVFYLAGMRYVQGFSLYQTSDGFSIFKYSPFFAMLMAPLSFLSESFAKSVWLFLNMFSLLRIINLLLEKSSQEKRIAVFFAVWAITPFLVVHVLYGQVNLIVLYIMLLAMKKIDEKKMSAGFFVALGVLIKLTPIIVLPYMIWRKQWKSLLVFSSSLVLLLGVSLMRFSPPYEEFSSWFHTMKSGHSLFDPYYYPYNNNLQNLISSLFSYPDFKYLEYKKNLFSLPVASVPFIFCVIVIFIGGVSLFLIEDLRKKERFSWIDAAAPMVLAQTILSPLAWHHNFVNMMIPIFIICCDKLRLKKYKTMTIFLLYPILYHVIARFAEGPRIFLFYWPCLISALFVLYVLAVSQYQRRKT
ncbi:MAG: glycosyltransferase family 87 protein [Oligoflexales bacterium]